MQPPTRPHFSHQWRDLDVIQQLHELPDRVAEVCLTAAIGAPNPSARVEKTKKPKKPANTLVPVNLDVIDALAPESAGKGVHYEIALAVKAVFEDHPHLPLVHEPTIASDCAWLIEHAAAWRPDEFLCAFVTDAVDHAHRVLQALCRVEPPPRYRCPTCTLPMHPAEGDWLRCEGGHQHPGPIALARQWRRKPARKASEIVDMFAEVQLRVSHAQLRRWRARRKLPHAGMDGPHALYLPWDVLCLLRPDVAAVDTAQAG